MNSVRTKNGRSKGSRCHGTGFSAAAHMSQDCLNSVASDGPGNNVSPFDLNLRHLHAVRAIARHGSISQACSEVHLSQPAITQGLAKLERSIGIRIFDRHKSGMRPTRTGAVFLERVDRATSFLKKSSQIAKDQARFERFLNFSKIWCLLAVIQHRSYASAAQATGLSEASIHRAVRESERCSEVELIVSSGCQSKPTQAAEHFALHARLAINELVSALSEIAAVQGVESARIRIGAMPLCRMQIIPVLLTEFRREFPDVSIEIREGNYTELLARLREGELDLLIGALREPEPCAGIFQAPLFDSRLVLVGRWAHPLAGRKNLSIDDLRQYSWIVPREGSPSRELWKSLFFDAGVPLPQAVVECGSFETIRGLLLEGDWITLFSPAQIRIEEGAKLLRRLSGSVGVPSRVIGVTRRTDCHYTRPQLRLLEMLRSIVQKEPDMALSGRSPEFENSMSEMVRLA